MKTLTVYLYDREGFEIASRPDCLTMKEAKERARHMLSDTFAETSETTHARLQTMKVAIFREGERTGADCVCEWDQFHPQHAVWEAAQDALEAAKEASE